jgi:hypothetical protein
MDEVEKQRMIEMTKIYREGLRDLLRGYANIDKSIRKLKEESIQGLAMFEHYRNQILETHRILEAEYQRRWGSLEL